MTEVLEKDVIIPPAFYHGEEAQQAEAAGIFSRCWMFVGFTDQVAEPGQFLTAEIGGTSVVVQNFDGELRALHNVCTHRFAPIQAAKCGKRSLTCPYHGWTFNKDGLPFIPGNAEFFGLDEAERRQRALRRFPLEACGRFLFVRLSAEGISLDEHLGDYGPILRHLSETFVDPITEERQTWQANWKFGVESVLEVYHVGMVHPETFKNFVQSRWDIGVAGQHSNGTAYLSEGSVKWWEGARRHLKLKQSDRLTNYDHFFIFPNLAIGMTHGCLMSVQTYLPLSPETCELHYRLFLADSELPGGQRQAVRQAVIDNVTSFNRTILGEDRDIMEQVQKGNRQMTMPQLPGRNEARIRDFHRAWQAWMDGKA